MVSCPGELFRRGDGDETFADEMRMISMTGWLKGKAPCFSPALDAARQSAASRGQLYFAWGCFRDFCFELPCTAERHARCTWLALVAHGRKQVSATPDGPDH